MNSGGLDSASLAKKLQADGYEVWSLYLNCHLDNEVEAKAAVEETALRYCTHHHEMDFDLGVTGTITEGDFRGVSFGTPWCFSMVGTVYARANGIYLVYTGIKGKPMPADYTKRINQLIDDVRLPVTKAHVVAPFMDEMLGSYAEILKYTQATAKEMAYTVSCAFTPPCGVCFRCVNRAAVGLPAVKVELGIEPGPIGEVDVPIP
jgi:7-cyano-7-deazaguanine synthase in queuosine biosynthesis